MSFDRVFNVAAAIVTLAVVTVVVTSSRTSGIITSVGNAFSGSIKAATGR